MQNIFYPFKHAAAKLTSHCLSHCQLLQQHKAHICLWALCLLDREKFTGDVV